MVNSFSRRILWWLGHGSGHAQPHFTHRFRQLLHLTGFVSLLWLLIYFIVVYNFSETPSTTVCDSADTQIMEHCKISLLYFLVVACSRVALLVPGVVTYYIRFQPTESNILCRSLNALIHVPLYAYCCSVLMYISQLMKYPVCAERNPELYFSIRCHVAYNTLVAIVYVLLGAWHANILMHTTSAPKVKSRQAPANLIHTFKNITFDETLFGDEGDKRYPSQCAICLDDFREGVTIKLTPCEHTFHEDCLRGWFGTERTCALCRCDLSLPPSKVPKQSPLDISRGSPNDTVANETNLMLNEFAGDIAPAVEPPVERVETFRVDFDHPDFEHMRYQGTGDVVPDEMNAVCFEV